MGRVDPRIKNAASVNRDKEMKSKEDFATGNLDQNNLILPSDVVNRGNAELIKANGEKVKEEKPKNFDINFITDEVFELEKVYLPYTPHSDLILLIGPRIKTKTDLVLTPDQQNEMMKTQLDKLGQGYRVLAVSNKARMQNMSQMKVKGSDEEVTLEEFVPGDYVFFNASIIVLHDMKPYHDHLMYYQIRNMDVRFSMTHKQALNFEPKTK